MNPTTLRDRLRREVREAVFCACRQRLVGAPVAAEDWLATEIALLRVQHEGAGVTDTELTMWQREDEDTFAHAKLVSELVAEQIGRVTANQPALAPAVAAEPVLMPTRSRRAAEPDPVSGVPGLADLLQDMLDQEQRPRARPA